MMTAQNQAFVVARVTVIQGLCVLQGLNSKVIVVNLNMNVPQDVVKAIAAPNKQCATRIAKAITTACTPPVAATATAPKTSFAKATKAQGIRVTRIQSA